MKLIDFIYSNSVKLEEFIEFLKEDSHNFNLIRPYLGSICWEDTFPLDDSRILLESKNIKVLYDFYEKLNNIERFNLIINNFPSQTFSIYFKNNEKDIPEEYLIKESAKNPEFSRYLLSTNYVKFNSQLDWFYFFKNSVYLSNLLNYGFYYSNLPLYNLKAVENILKYKEDLKITINIDLIDLIDTERLDLIKKLNNDKISEIICFIDFILENDSFFNEHIGNFSLGLGTSNTILKDTLFDIKKELVAYKQKNTNYKAFSNCIPEKSNVYR